MSLCTEAVLEHLDIYSISALEQFNLAHDSSLIFLIQTEESERMYFTAFEMRCSISCPSRVKFSMSHLDISECRREKYISRSLHLRHMLKSFFNTHASVGGITWSGAALPQQCPLYDSCLSIPTVLNTFYFLFFINSGPNHSPACYYCIVFSIWYWEGTEVLSGVNSTAVNYRGESWMPR